MLARRLFLPLFALLATTAPTAYNRPKPTAPVLPEIFKHLDQAHDAMDHGELEKAMAHTDVVLVADEIVVAVAFDGVPEGQREDCDRAVDRAIGAWEEAFEGKVAFRRANSSEAHLKIVFRPDVRLQGEAVAGLLNWKRTISGMNGKTVGHFRAEMPVRTSQPGGDPMTFDAIRHTVTHEMGHVFGLEDTDHVGELMGPLNMRRPLAGPMPHEQNAVREIRREAQAIRAEARKM